MGGSVVGVARNAGLLATARTRPQPPDAAPIEWREGDATAPPFPDAACEVGLGPQGLQFFPDQPRALRDMRRVLVPTGRLVLSVWRGLPHCPWQRAVAAALEWHVSAAAAAHIRAPFALGDAAAFRALLTEAGFRTVHIRIESQMMRQASLEEFVPGYLSATLVAGGRAPLEEPIRAAILQEVNTFSLEGKRCGRRTKPDRLDASKLLPMLIRPCTGEQKVWSVVPVPSVVDEDRRYGPRDLEEMQAERTQHSKRITGLLASCGLAVREVGEELPTVLEGLRLWDGQAVPGERHQRLLREFARLQFVPRQLRELANERARRRRTAESDPASNPVRQLLERKGFGPKSAWRCGQACFAWRQIATRRQLGALAGVPPTPYQSGDSERAQGSNKAGNRRIRAMASAIAWCWVRYQPHSAWRQWSRQRFGQGHRRLRRIGIVAVARQLFVQ
jgi:transposase